MEDRHANPECEGQRRTFRRNDQSHLHHADRVDPAHSGQGPGGDRHRDNYVDPHDWIVGGRTLAEQGKSSVYFDIKITDETNTKSEKAAYIQAAFEGFARLLGNLHEESYIYVQDVRAASYGYGGRTQEWRYQRAG
jgi:4-oxalocrotonate tautomerase